MPVRDVGMNYPRRGRVILSVVRRGLGRALGVRAGTRPLRSADGTGELPPDGLPPGGTSLPKDCLPGGLARPGGEPEPGRRHQADTVVPRRLIRLTEPSISGRLVTEISTVSRAPLQYSARARASGPVVSQVLPRL